MCDENKNNLSEEERDDTQDLQESMETIGEVPIEGVTEESDSRATLENAHDQLASEAVEDITGDEGVEQDESDLSVSTDEAVSNENDISTSKSSDDELEERDLSLSDISQQDLETSDSCSVETDNAKDAVASRETPSHKNIKFIVPIIALTAIITAIVIWFVSQPRPEELNAHLTVNGVSISYPNTWNVSDVTDDGVIYIYPDFDGLVMINAQRISGTESMNETDARNSIRHMYNNTSIKVNDAASESIDGFIAERLSFSWTSEDSSTTQEGTAVEIQVGENVLSVLAGTATDASESAKLTMDEVIDSVRPTGKQLEVTLMSEDGKVLDQVAVYDIGRNTGLDIPSSLDALPENVEVVDWKPSDSRVTITKNDDGSYSADGITEDTDIICVTEDRYIVTFEDGNGGVLNRVLVKPGESAQAPSDPTRTGYNFTGWDKPFNNITSDLTVSATWKEIPKVYSAGTYRVGIDIPAGEYAIDANGLTMAYYCVYPDISKNDILGNNNFYGREYVTVTDGMILEASRATFYLAEGAIAKNDYETSSGTYKIGFDMPSGTYRLIADTGTMGYYCIYNNSSPDADIVQNNNFEGQDYVNVSDGQYLELSRCVAEPA